MSVDITIILAYFVIINVIGIKYSGSSSIGDYFLGNRSVHWVLVCLSIVATETSSLTFLSIPGLAYVKGMGFIQVAFGYLVGRALVALVLLPRYLTGNFETVYQFLQHRFSVRSRKAVSVVFHVTRLLADSVRLFATAIPLTLLVGWDYRISLAVIGAFTFIYTIYGGIKSVVVVDVLQLFVYILAVVAGLFVVDRALPGSFFSVFRMIDPADLRPVSWGLQGGAGELFNSYNLVSGVIGGAFLSFASHGTDHIIVQRILTCRDLRAARKAMVFSGVVVLAQFALFLLWGLFIKALLNARHFASSDEIVPFFIVHHMPAGLRGLALAGIFAAAMSTLSSTINSLSSSTVFDILGLAGKNISEQRKVAISRWVSALWTCVIIAVSMAFKDTPGALVEIGLSIASITYGSMMGIFVMGRYFKGMRDSAALVGVFMSIAVMCVVALTTALFWLWYVAVGFFVALAAALLVNLRPRLS